mgnify:CR=1 FL=1
MIDLGDLVGVRAGRAGPREPVGEVLVERDGLSVHRRVRRPRVARGHHPRLRGAHVLLAGGLAFAGNPWLALWMAPVALGLLSSPAQSVLTSSARLGRISQTRRLFLTVDDTARAPELTALAQSRGGAAEAGRGRAEPTWLADEVPASSS